jgi:gliding motility-associated lipoprotein GldD
MRIETPEPVYELFAPEGFPCSFHVSFLAEAELPPSDRLTLSYPSLGARIYCSYLPVEPSGIEEVFRKSESLISRHARKSSPVRLQSYSDPEERGYAMLYEPEDSPASPVQFILTDSSRHFFCGVLLYNHSSAADSLAPVSRYLKADIIELIQSFRWKK